MQDQDKSPILSVQNLNFELFGKAILHDISLEILPGERCLLIGPNGAGKSTLLRVLAGLHISFHHGKFDVLGTDRPNDQFNGLCYMGNRWVKQVSFTGTLPHMADVAAGDMMADWQQEHLARRDELVELLGIDLAWRMHQVSDGQRKKVQIMLALLKPFRFVIIDEFVSELDVVVRNKLYMYLDREVTARNGSILYASHVFDNLELYFSSVVVINNGKLSPKKELMADFMRNWKSETSLFMAVYNRLREEELSGNTKIEQAQILDTTSFKGSGYGSGRGGFLG